MLAGAGGIDLVMLVVAADESVMPQTREHFDICRLLHVPAGLIALTKIDLADADLQTLAALEARELTSGSFLDAAPIVGVSSRTGEGLDALRAALVEAARRAPVRHTERATRLPIDRVFSARGFGTVVTGTLIEGRIAVGDELALLPSGRATAARGLHVHGESRTSASAGERVAVNLGGVELADVSRGDTLSVAGALGSTVRVDARVDMLPGAAPLRHGACAYASRRHHRVARAGIGGGADVGRRPPRDVAGRTRRVSRRCADRDCGGGTRLRSRAPRVAGGAHAR